MNKNTLLFLLLANTSWAQQPVFLNYSAFGFTDILLTPENDLIAVGRNFADDRIELWKLNSNGDEIWHKTLPIFERIVMDNINITNDHNYIVSGNFIQAPGLTKLAFIKFSPEGEIIWESYPEILKSVEVGNLFQLADNSFVMTGTSGNSGKPYYSLIHFDSTASNLLDFTQHLVENDTFFTNWQTPKDSYLNIDNESIIAVCDDNTSGSSINSDAYVMNFSTSGQLIWKTKIDLGQTDKVASALPLKDKSIAICGHTNQDFFTTWTRAFVTKLNGNGEVLWTNYYDSTGIGAPLAGLDLLELKNGDLLITGSKIGAPKYNIFMLLIDSLGNEKNRMVLWRDDHDDSPRSMVKLENNIIAIAGSQDGFWLYKNLLVLFPLSVITDTKNLIIDSPLFEVYPNPVGTELSLRYEQMESRAVRLEIYSSTGDVLYSGSPQGRIEMSSYPNGIYYFVMSDSGASKTYLRTVVKGR